MNDLQVNIPEVKAEVETAFAGYEKALGDNDVVALDGYFRDAPETIRYGGAENLYGFAEIAAFRAGRSSAGLTRRIERTVITTYGHDYATASTLFYRDSVPGKTGRQMQTWLRTAQGWKVVAAHVSMMSS